MSIGCTPDTSSGGMMSVSRFELEVKSGSAVGDISTGISGPGGITGSWSIRWQFQMKIGDHRVQ